jgi:hypothetical protein
MSDFQNEMNRVVQGFVAQIAELARRAAIDTLESAFGGGGGGGGGGRAPRGGGGSAGAATAAIASASFGRVGRPRGGRGAKRTAADLDALSDKFASFVKANPGLRIEQINKQLGTTTKDLALPIRKLIGEGQITAKGQKRSTTYFAGKKKGKN